jgi:SRSO17 transposase
MLPDSTVPGSLAYLLAVFRPCFTAPTFRAFTGLIVGLIASTRRRTVCGMLTGAGLERVRHHSRAHRFFAVARWSSDAVGLALTDLIVARLQPAESPLTIAVDDTLFKRSGKKVRLGAQKLGPRWSGSSGWGAMPAWWRMVQTVEAPIR